MIRALSVHTAMLRAACEVEYAAGARKSDIARRAGVSRVTLDAWLRA